MLDFPPYFFTPVSALILLVILITVIYLKFFSHGKKVHSYKEVEIGDRIVKPLVFGFIALIFISCGLFFSITSSLSIYKFRNVNVSEVSGFEITKIEDESEPKTTNKKVNFDNFEVAQKMLRTLENCKSFSRNHESLSNGFRLKIIFKNNNNDPNLYFSVYLERNKSLKPAVLIPHSESVRAINLGEFTCKEFEDLLKQHIQPLF